MQELRLKLEIEIDGPFATKGTTPGGYGVDAALLRNRSGQPLLPGSQVRGRVRDALEELDVAGAGLSTDLDPWFGPPVNLDDPTPDRGPRRFSWTFSDFVAADKKFESTDPYARLLTRIRIDRDTGSVAGGAMLVAETAALPSERIVFTGTLDLSATDSGGLVRAVQWAYRGLCWVPTLGAFRGVGFGRVVSLRFTPVRLVAWSGDATAARALVLGAIRSISGDASVLWPSDPTPPARTTPTADRFALTIAPAAPFCVGGHRKSRNVLTSLDYLPGSVIKGAVAIQLARVLGLKPRQNLSAAPASSWPDLCKHFSNVRFLTAFPSDTTVITRPTVPPLSLVKVAGRDQCLDVAMCEKPFLFKVGKDLIAPEFSTDWKKPDVPGFSNPPARPRRELRMHTAIDPQYRRVRSKHLFGQQVVHQGYWKEEQERGKEQEKKWHAVSWRGVIDLMGVPDTARSLVRAQLADFFARATLRLGKTKAEAIATPGASAGASLCVPLPGDVWVLTLQSPAIILDPFEVATEWGKADPDPATRLYRAYFHEASSGAIELVRFFADQELQGGYLVARNTSRPYNPFLVTTAGSVFVLKATANATTAKSIVQDWERKGLPLPNWAEVRYGKTYDKNPFCPLDGFGEVAVNLPCHTSLRPKPAEIEELPDL